MTDVVSKEKRSLMMAGIRSKDTKPELIVRHGLHARGLRYRLHDRRLPGRPDLMFKKYRAVIFVHGCFWHGHGCHLFKWPQSRDSFWRDKIVLNTQNDALALARLAATGWRSAVIWECAIKGRARVSIDEIVDSITAWLHSNSGQLEIAGRS